MTTIEEEQIDHGTWCENCHAYIGDGHDCDNCAECGTDK